MCPSCVKRGVTIVPVLVAPVIEQKTSRATAAELLKPIAANLTAQLAALKAAPATGSGDIEAVAAGEFINGKIEAIENMLATLKGVRA